MPDIQKLNQTKEKILHVIRTYGPSFPTRISRETSISPLFVAAILSELVAEKKLNVSAMKVGSSPLYTLPGQEPELEKFSQYLNSKEREAFDLLKSSIVLDDEKQDPAIRVALRKLKDFAIPINAKNGETEKLFWKYFIAPENDVQERVESSLNINQAKQVQKMQVTDQEAKQEPPKPEPQSPISVAKAEPSALIAKKEPVAKEKTPKTKKDSQFAIKMKSYLESKNIELLQEMTQKPKEFSARISLDSTFGKQEFYLIAKDKKKITEDELTIAIQKAQVEKMPALIMSPGEPDKQAREYLKEWRNLIKFEKVKF